MNIKKFLPGFPFVALIAACVVACVTATVTEPSACDSQSVSFNLPSLPTIPAQYANVATCSQYSLNVPSVSASTPVDVSSALSKLTQVASKLTVNVNALTIDNSDGEFNWVNGVTVSVSTSSLPMATLATYSAPASGADVTIQPTVVMSGDNVLKYLSSGPATMTVTMTAQNVSACQAMTLETLPSTVTTSVNLCVSASGTVTKTLP